MFEIYDGQQWSYPASVTVTIEPINDNSPMLMVTARGIPFTEDSVESVQLLSGVVLSDLDHAERFNLTGAQVR